MASDVVYLRNNRPNGLIVQWGDLRFLLGRRGNRDDSCSFPAEAANDPTIARFIRTGIVEVINKDQFMTLSGRSTDDPVKVGGYRTKIADVNLPMEPESTSKTPYVIQDVIFDSQAGKDMRTPKLEFATPPGPTPTAEELVKLQAEAEALQNQVAVATGDEQAELKSQLAALQAVIAEQGALLAKLVAEKGQDGEVNGETVEEPAVNTVAPKKRATTASKRTTQKKKTATTKSKKS